MVPHDLECPPARRLQGTGSVNELGGPVHVLVFFVEGLIAACLLRYQVRVGHQLLVSAGAVEVAGQLPVHHMGFVLHLDAAIGKEATAVTLDGGHGFDGRDTHPQTLRSGLEVCFE